MLRTQLARSAVRAGKRTRPIASRGFVTTPPKRAEVELTVGESLDGRMERTS